MRERAAAVLPPAVFMDTSYVIALFRPDDRHNAAAHILALAAGRARTQLLTTHAVLLEVGDALARPAYRAGAVRILSALEADPHTHVLPVTEARYAAGRALYDARPDQTWGLTDCVSFVVMRELGLTTALTADRHFVQAGFRALLTEEAS